MREEIIGIDQLNAWVAANVGTVPGVLAAELAVREIERLRAAMTGDFRLGPAGLSFVQVQIVNSTTRGEDAEQEVKLYGQTADHCHVVITLRINELPAVGTPTVTPGAQHAGEPGPPARVNRLRFTGAAVEHAKTFGDAARRVNEFVNGDKEPPVVHPEKRQHVMPGEFPTIDAAEAEINRLRGLMDADPELLELSRERGVAHLGPHFGIRMLVHQFRDVFKQTGAENHVIMDIGRASEPDGMFEVTIRPKRRNAKTPGDIIRELLAENNGFRKQLNIEPAPLNELEVDNGNQKTKGA